MACFITFFHWKIIKAGIHFSYFQLKCYRIFIHRLFALFLLPSMYFTCKLRAFFFRNNWVVFNYCQQFVSASKAYSSFSHGSTKASSITCYKKLLWQHSALFSKTARWTSVSSCHVNEGGTLCPEMFNSHTNSFVLSMGFKEYSNPWRNSDGYKYIQDSRWILSYEFLFLWVEWRILE